MATEVQDNDDKLRTSVQATLEALLDLYWDAKTAQPSRRFDEIFDLRRAYEKAVVEYAALEGRLLKDAILTSDIDLGRFQQVEADMKAAIRTKEILAIAADFVKAMIRLV
jgi:hypothetical protein